ncbi:unnamed protein product [Urochloa decumbens]|uniref:PWWP domain-containing protein n=1 Tax=Urochloa decumbens TaxID=240449 RepID=A0ABC8W5U5_9POAL
MAPSPVVAERDAALRVAVLPKDAAFVDGEGSTVRLPGRLRVMHPHVAEFLRSPRRAARPATKPSPAPAWEAERVRYGCAFGDDDEGGAVAVAAPGRLVWGKVRDHPWWPGQVFDAADASALALARRRPRGAALVAYFWDKSFAWNETGTLLPFRDGFPRFGAVTPVAAAVEAALDEVSRRVEAGLSCYCCCGGGKDKDNNEATANRQVIDNAGVREGAYGAAVVAAFARRALRGEALVGYVSALAAAPRAGADRIDLAVATAQLRAFGRWRGSARGLPEYTLVHGIDGAAAAPGRAKRRRSSSTGGGSGKRSSMSRSSAKGKAASDGGDYEALELEDFPQATPQQMSTKIGKLMSRAARQMSLSPVILSSNGINTPAPPPAAAMPNMARCARVADAEDELCPMNNGDPTSGAVVVNGGRPAAEAEQVGLVLNFSSSSAVPSTVHLTMIFSRFGPVEEVRVEKSTALVIFKKGAHADEAFAGTSKMSSIRSSLISFRLTCSLPPAPTDPPQSVSLDPLPVEPLHQ